MDVHLLSPETVGLIAASAPTSAYLACSSIKAIGRWRRARRRESASVASPLASTRNELTALLTELQSTVEGARATAARLDGDAAARREEFDSLLRDAHEITRVASWVEAVAMAAATGVLMTSAPEPGRIFMRTDDGSLKRSIALELMGNRGISVIQFISGQTVPVIVESINRVRAETGLSANVVPDNPNLAQITSIDVGSDAFVRVRRLTGPRDHREILLDENRENAASAQKDFGVWR